MREDWNTRVILVGAGPGDPGLLTLKGLDAIKRADCIIYDRLASPELLAMAREDAECIYVGKENHHHTLPQDKINELLLEKAKEYKLTVRLKGGDSYVFGRGGEEGLYLMEHGICFEVVPGVTSAVAGLAAAGIPITHRGVATSFRVLTAHGKEDTLASIDFDGMNVESETLVFLMGLAHVGEVAEHLMQAGRSADTPAAVISHATTPMQRSVVGRLADIASLVAIEGITSPAIIVVGNVVSLQEQLCGGTKEKIRTCIVPMIRGLVESGEASLASRLRKEGMSAHEIAIGRIRRMSPPFPTDSSSVPDFIIFTSRNGVEAFFLSLSEMEMDLRSFAKTRFVVIGQKTRESLRRHGILADFCPSKSCGKSLAEELSGIISDDSRIWYLKGREGGQEILEALKLYPGFKEFILYENCPIYYSEDLLSAYRTQIASADAIAFTSASSVRRIMELCTSPGDKAALPAEVYSIGPTTSRALMEYGISDYLEAEEMSYEALCRKACHLD